MPDHRPLDDHTVDADPEALERLRRLAAAAQAEHAAPDHTVDADEAALERIREVARAAQPDPPPARSAPLPSPRPPRDLSQLEVPDVAEFTRRRPPPAADAAEPWRPPSRSVRPAARQQPTRQHPHPLWRWAAITLAVVVAALLTWLLLGGDDDEPLDVPTGPTVTAPPIGVVNTGAVGEGGSGG